jgi:hypothetical protein
MLASRRTTSGVRAGLSSSLLALAALASGGGCTLLVGGQLADKPLEGAGGGQGGDGGAASTGSRSTSGTGGLMCKPGTADCDGYLPNGCETKTLTDAKNCGACKNDCQDGKSCKDGKCEK